MKMPRVTRKKAGHRTMVTLRCRWVPAHGGTRGKTDVECMRNQSSTCIRPLARRTSVRPEGPGPVCRCPSAAEPVEVGDLRCTQINMPPARAFRTMNPTTTNPSLLPRHPPSSTPPTLAILHSRVWFSAMANGSRPSMNDTSSPCSPIASRPGGISLPRKPSGQACTMAERVRAARQGVVIAWN